MPSAITQTVLDGADFKKFAEACARQFGYLASLRDADPDAPLPDTVNDRALKSCEAELQKAEKRLKHVQKMSYARAFNAAAKDYRRELSIYQDSIARNADACFKLGQMLVKAANYQPPTPDHAPLKQLMIDQLAQTIEYDGNPAFYLEQIAKLRQLTPKEYKTQEIARAKRDIARASEDLTKLRERTEKSNTWIAQLKASLK